MKLNIYYIYKLDYFIMPHVIIYVNSYFIDNICLNIGNPIFYECGIKGIKMFWRKHWIKHYGGWIGVGQF